MNKIFYKKKNVYRNVRWITTGIADWWPSHHHAVVTRWLCSPAVWHLIHQLELDFKFSPTIGLCLWAKLLLQIETCFKNHTSKFILLPLLYVNHVSLVFCIESDYYFLFIMEVRWWLCFVTKEPYQHTSPLLAGYIHANWVPTSQLERREVQ